jgi:hypothetical protein
MNTYYLYMALAMSLVFPARAEQKAPSMEQFGAKPLRGDYQVHGGTLSERLPPTQKDRKVAFMLTGSLAKELFSQIGPDVKESCSAAADYRERSRGDLTCTHTKSHGFACYLGLDVHTGKSTDGSIC